MQVKLTGETEAPPTATLILGSEDLASLRGGGALPFSLLLGGETRRCALLLLGSRAHGADATHTLRIEPLALNAVAIGGAVAPVFEDLPFGVVLRADPAMWTTDGPVRVSPSVSFQRIRATASRALAPVYRVRPSAALGERAGMLGLAALFFAGAWVLRGYPGSAAGLSVFGAVGLWGAIGGTR